MRTRKRTRERGQESFARSMQSSESETKPTKNNFFVATFLVCFLWQNLLSSSDRRVCLHFSASALEEQERKAPSKWGVCSLFFFSLSLSLSLSLSSSTISKKKKNRPSLGIRPPPTGALPFAPCRGHLPCLLEALGRELSTNAARFRGPRSIFFRVAPSCSFHRDIGAAAVLLALDPPPRSSFFPPPLTLTPSLPPSPSLSLSLKTLDSPPLQARVSAVTVASGEPTGPVLRKPEAGGSAPSTSGAPSTSAPSSGGGGGGVTVEFQRSQAKAMQAYFRALKADQVAKDNQRFGWTSKNEILNGRHVMGGIFVGLLTEYSTGVNFIDQLKLTVSLLGIADIYD